MIMTSRWIAVAFCGLSLGIAGLTPSPSRADHTAPVAGEIRAVNETLDKLNQSATDLFHSVILNIEAKRGAYPEYEQAFDSHIERIEKASQDYTNTIEKIRVHVETELSQVYSELATLEKAYQENPSKGLRKLIDLKLATLKDIKATIQRQINPSYAKTIASIYTLDDTLGVPVARFRYVLAATCVIGLGLGILPGAACFTESSGFYRAWDPAGDRYGVLKKQNLIAIQREAGKRMFQGCKSAGCIYFLTEDYKYWIGQVRSLNRNIELISGISLLKIKTPSERKTEKALDAVADLAASRLPDLDIQK